MSRTPLADRRTRGPPHDSAFDRTTTGISESQRKLGRNSVSCSPSLAPGFSPVSRARAGAAVSTALARRTNELTRRKPLKRFALLPLRLLPRELLLCKKLRGALEIAGLLKDLKARGLLQDTLVLWGGEFGRTPAAQGGRDGRDHNPEGFTMWMAGGGVKPGIAYGATDDYGWFAAENKIHIHDLHATLLALLGMDHERLTYRHAGRDFRLTDVEGHVVSDIFA